MDKNTLRNNIGRRSVNSIFLVGEVVDMGVTPGNYGLTVRARLKLRTTSKHNTFVYLDVYGKRSRAEVMSLVCQTGNIVYVEGEFRNATIDKLNIKPYILVTHIECLLRRRDVAPPDASIISMLDSVDPIGYFEKRGRKKRKKHEIKEESKSD